ncbi:DNA polymerase I [Teichococcus vastitatis]|uniref:DNA polymerase I n=1 Tax=Teichococcus vastitatis TaxID=2307076 RepID=A0ABS9WBA5_9PROT|nr:DNA polymerase I [Pseudoroseomonas vastitatis]MCI0756586.1 DNA polymerase I [Pseudoroseomonas vastitatis]
MADAAVSPDILAEPVKEAEPHLILVDGSGYIFRAFHALPPMTRPDGVPVNAVFGFTNMLGQFLTRHAGTHIAVVFDASRVTFRNAIYDQYKAHRPEAPPELVPQFSLIREATAAYGVACIELDGYEADDLIGAYAKGFQGLGGQVTIVSSDKDLMQLVRPGVQLLDPIKQKPIREPEVMEKFGVTPDKVVDVQALAGDSTDNVPGVPGIGIKTAAALINEYGDLEGLLAAAAAIKQPKRREALVNNAELARISKKLVTLDCDAPLPRPIDELLARPPEPGRLAGFLREQGFRSLLHRMGLDGDAAPETAPVSRPRFVPQLPEAAPGTTTEITPAADSAPFGPYETVVDEAGLAPFIAAAREAGVMAVDTETDSLDALHANLVGISLAVAPGRACYIPLRHGLPPGTGDMLQEAPVAPAQMSQDAAVAALRPLLEDPAVMKVLHNAKYDLEVLCRPEHGGIAVSPVDDTMLISYSMDAGRHGHGMDELSLRHLGHKPITYDEVTGTGRARIPFGQVALDKATAYAAEDADVTLRLWHALKPRLRPDQALVLYEQVERRMVAVLRDMEIAGIKVDGAELTRIGEDFSQRMVVLEKEIQDLAGRPFNVGSPKQLGEILFDEQKLPGGKRGKAGAWGTDAAVLEDLASRGHELPRKVLHWRQLSKLKSTYVEGLAAQIDPRDHRVHTDFSMAITSTGRLSSTEPNLQNIPIRTEEGARIRRAFVAEPGHVLLAADYSQIELRLLAHLADVPSLREAFEKGEDIHSRTAADIFNLAPDQVDREARRRAKTINFGIIYGMSAFGLASRLGIPAAEARSIIEAYFSRYPGILEEMERLKSEAREKGYVTTPFGRKLWIDGIQAKEQARRGNAERAAINAPFQGGAAEIIKRAMVRMPRALREAGLSARMLLQVHDELLFEVPEAEIEATANCVRQVMEGVAELRVPLRAEIGHGPNWGVAH